MGSYIYKVSLKRTVSPLNAPAPIHVSTYAYKPYGRCLDDDRLARLSGAARCEKDWAADRSRDVLVVHAYSNGRLDPKGPNPVIHLAHGCCGTVYDGIFDDDRYLVGHVSKINGRWVYVPREAAVAAGGAA